MDTQKGEVKPAFEVTKLPLDYKTKRTVYQYVKDKNGVAQRQDKEVVESGGYLVKTPKNGSFRVRSLAELRRMNLDQQPALIHMESGEEVPTYVRSGSVADRIAKLEDDE